MNTEEQKNIEDTKVEDKSASLLGAIPPSEDSKKSFRGGEREHKKNQRRGPKKEARVRPEFDHKTVSIRRVTRVVAGGRRFSFSVTLVAGNRKGLVGVGQGKAGDTPLAIEKALRDAKKNMVSVRTTKEMSVPHETHAKYGSCRVTIMPAPGRGILAGSSVRTVLELAGLSSVNAKILSGSKNRANIAKAAVHALGNLSRTSSKK